MVKNKLEVRIAGTDYTLMGTESDEYLQKIALYIDKKLNTIMKQNSKLSTSMAAVLTSINVADEYFKCNEEKKYSDANLEMAHNEIDRLKADIVRLTEKVESLTNKNTELQVALAKKDSEINEYRTPTDRNSKLRLYANK